VALVEVGSNREIENGECVDVIMRAIGGSKRVMWPHPMSCRGSFQVRKDIWLYLAGLWLVTSLYVTRPVGKIDRTRIQIKYESMDNQ